MTKEIAYAAATDAGNRNMRANGRTAWNADDRNAAFAEYNRLWPMRNDMPFPHRSTPQT